MKNGEVVCFSPEGARIAGDIHVKDVFVDTSGAADVGNIVVRDRQILSEEGLVVAVATVDYKHKQVLAGPDILSRGFVYIKANHKLMNDSIQVIKDAIQANFEHKKFDWTELKQDMRSSLGKFLYKQTNRRPVVLPVVMEVNQNRHRAMQNRHCAPFPPAPRLATRLIAEQPCRHRPPPRGGLALQLHGVLPRQG